MGILDYFNVFDPNTREILKSQSYLKPTSQLTDAEKGVAERQRWSRGLAEAGSAMAKSKNIWEAIAAGGKGFHEGTDDFNKAKYSKGQADLAAQEVMGIGKPGVMKQGQLFPAINPYFDKQGVLRLPNHTVAPAELQVQFGAGPHRAAEGVDPIDAAAAAQRILAGNPQAQGLPTRPAGMPGAPTPTTNPQGFTPTPLWGQGGGGPPPPAGPNVPSPPGTPDRVPPGPGTGGIPGGPLPGQPGYTGPVQAPPAGAAGPPPGTVVGGRRFMGGDWRNPQAWVPVQ